MSETAGLINVRLSLNGATGRLYLLDREDIREVEELCEKLYRINCAVAEHGPVRPVEAIPECLLPRENSPVC